VPSLFVQKKGKLTPWLDVNAANQDDNSITTSRRLISYLDGGLAAPLPVREA